MQDNVIPLLGRTPIVGESPKLLHLTWIAYNPVTGKLTKRQLQYDERFGPPTVSNGELVWLAPTEAISIAENEAPVKWPEADPDVY